MAARRYACKGAQPATRMKKHSASALRCSLLSVPPILLLCLYACVKMPDGKTPQSSQINYRFEGGRDLTALFDLTATYTAADGRSIREPIASLPWSKNIRVGTPFDGTLRVGFSARTDIPERETYRVGFDGSVTYSAADTKTASAATGLPTSRAAGSGPAFRVTLPDGIAAEAVELTIPALKYDKRFAFSYTVDDSRAGAYSRIWSRINGKWIDDKVKFHVNTPRSTGHMAEGTTAMTDGCGNERRFGFGIAICASDGNEHSPQGFISEDDPNSQYVCWADLRTIVDFGNSVYFHNIDRRSYDEQSPASIAQGYEHDRLRAEAKLGRSMKVLALPDGLKTYIAAAQSYDPIAFIRTSLAPAGSEKPRIYLGHEGSLYKRQTYDGISGDPAVPLAELAAQSASDDPYWVCHTTHSPSNDIMEMFGTISDTYGKGGLDNIWVASFDEIYEYRTMRDEARIEKEVDGQTVTFRIALPEHSDFYFRELSFVLRGAGAGCTVETASDDVVGLFHAPGNNGELINVCFDPALPALAEKYTARYEASAEETDRADALYFASRLLPRLAAPFRERIDAVAGGSGLRILSVLIDGGAAETTDRNVEIAVETEGTPAQYRIGEQPDLSASAWKTYPGSRIGYTLSPGSGTKTIYLQLRNPDGVSPVAEASIRYRGEEADPGEIGRDEVGAYQQRYDGYEAVYRAATEASPAR